MITKCSAFQPGVVTACRTTRRGAPLCTDPGRMRGTGGACTFPGCCRAAQPGREPALLREGRLSGWMGSKEQQVAGKAAKP